MWSGAYAVANLRAAVWAVRRALALVIALGLIVVAVVLLTGISLVHWLIEGNGDET